MLRQHEQHTARRVPARTGELSQSLLHGFMPVQSVPKLCVLASHQDAAAPEADDNILCLKLDMVSNMGPKLLCLMAGMQQRLLSRRCLTRQWRARGL
jgi:hypothetical protein